MIDYSTWGNIAKIALGLFVIIVAVLVIGRKWFKEKKITAVIGIMLSVIMLAVVGFSVFSLVQGVDFANYATGTYTSLRQTHNTDGNEWNVACDAALNEGSFNHRIPVKDAAPQMLNITSSCEEGSLTLFIRQDDYVESIDISNTDGNMPYDLSNFTGGEDIILSVEHTVAKGIQFDIGW